MLLQMRLNFSRIRRRAKILLQSAGRLGGKSSRVRDRGPGGASPAPTRDDDFASGELGDGSFSRIEARAYFRFQFLAAAR